MSNVNIAVLIPHYNNPSALEKSLESISAQEPVDVVIVDDGSQAKPDMGHFRKKFTQIPDLHLIPLETNRGIEHALNAGLAFIVESKKYRYVARLDQGDLCYPERFRVQKEYLEKNPDVALLGAWASYESMSGKVLFTAQPPCDHETIRKMMFLNNMFIHPSVMVRVAAIEKIGYYDVSFRDAEDYAYFFRFVKNFRTANIGRVLLRYEVNPAGMSLSRRKRQIAARIRVIVRNWEWGLYPAWGLIKNSVLYFLPYALVESLKKRRS